MAGTTSKSTSSIEHIPHDSDRRPVYVWQFPVRIFHWINVFAIVILFLTGMYIAKPLLVAPGEATQNFVMGTIRYWHGVTAYIFTANLIFRLYWFIVGNEYSKMRFWQKNFWGNMVSTIKYYLFMKSEHQNSLGHNSLAQLMYFFFVWLASGIMILTGFAMRVGTDQSGILGSLFSWVIPAFNSESQVRMFHHLFAWGYVIFLLGHLYMVIRQDILDDDGTISSIINGYKLDLSSNVHSNKRLANEFVPKANKP